MSYQASHVQASMSEFQITAGDPSVAESLLTLKVVGEALLFRRLLGMSSGLPKPTRILGRHLNRFRFGLAVAFS